MAAQFEIRQMRLGAARKLLGTAIGMCPKAKLFRCFSPTEEGCASMWPAAWNIALANEHRRQPAEHNEGGMQDEAIGTKAFWLPCTQGFLGARTSGAMYNLPRGSVRLTAVGMPPVSLNSPSPSLPSHLRRCLRVRAGRT